MMPSAVSKTKQKHSRTFSAIGTEWEIELFDHSSDTTALWLEIEATIDGYDAVYSRFRADSTITRISREAGQYVLPENSAELIVLYRRLYEVTDGAVTPLIGQVLCNLGYDAAYSLRVGTAQTPPDWDAVLDYSAPTLSVSQPSLLDFGAAGKGHLVDLVGAVIERHGISAYCIDAGGDIRVRGKTLSVGLEHPHDTGLAIGQLELSNKSICGSAGNRRVWSEYSHIVNPYSLTSPKDIIATWVVASDTLTADGLSTALFFTDPASLQAEFAFDYLIVKSDLSTDASPLFREALFY